MSRQANPRAIIHFSPHPDDELIGAPATLFALRDAGHPVVNVACSLGRPVDRRRRRAELVEACTRAGFQLVIADDLPGGGEDDLPRAEPQLAELAARLVSELRCGYVVSPSPHDGHPAHEAVGRAVRDALTRLADPPPWGMWGLWSELPLPNLYIPFERERLREIRHALRAHAGELARNDYGRLIGSRARTNAILGAERVFGFGAHNDGTRYAELLTEVVLDGDGYWRTPPGRRPRVDAAGSGATAPSLSGTGAEPIGAWLYRASDRELLRGPSGPAAPGPPRPTPAVPRSS